MTARPAKTCTIALEAFLFLVAFDSFDYGGPLVPTALRLVAASRRSRTEARTHFPVCFSTTEREEGPRS